MKPFAARMGRLKESGTVRVANAVAELRKQGRDIVSFSVGEPDFDTPAVVREAAKAALDRGETHYVPSWGIPELREAVAAKHREENRLPCEAKHVLVAPAKQCIFYAIMAVVDHGDEVLLPDPAWVTYEPLVRLAGGRPVPVPTRAEDGWRMTPEAVRAALERAPKAKMLIVNSPSNPTGGVQTRADLAAFAQMCRDRDLWLLSDELYEKILYEGEHVSPASLPGMFERTITVNGLSKSHAMTGWRMGWIVADLPLLKEANKLQQQSLTHPASFNQRAAVTALTMDPAPVKAMVAEFRVRRDLMLKGLRQIPGFSAATPPGAFYVFPKYDYAMDSLAFAEHLLHKGGVATTPGAEFGAMGEHHLRFSYATSQDKIQEGLRRIAEAVKDLPVRK